jgi:hypothetical protein
LVGANGRPVSTAPQAASAAVERTLAVVPLTSASRAASFHGYIVYPDANAQPRTDAPRDEPRAIGATFDVGTGSGSAA